MNESTKEDTGDAAIEANIRRAKKALLRWAEEVKDESEWAEGVLHLSSWNEDVGIGDEPSSDTPVIVVFSDCHVLTEILDSWDPRFASLQNTLKEIGFRLMPSEDKASFFVYSIDTEFSRQYVDFLKWQLNCEWMSPHYESLNAELSEVFDSSRSSVCEYESVLDSVFLNQGYEEDMTDCCEVRGVSYQVYHKDAIGPIVTLVSTKRLDQSDSIELLAVTALEKIFDDARDARGGLRLTTSKFLQDTVSFAPRQFTQIKSVATTEEPTWCTRAITDFYKPISQLVSNEFLVNLLAQVRGNKLACKVLYSDRYSHLGTSRVFSIVLKELHSTALVMQVPTHETCTWSKGAFSYGGTCEPQVDIALTDIIRDKLIFRVFSDCRQRIKYRGGGRDWYVWDGEPLSWSFTD